MFYVFTSSGVMLWYPHLFRYVLAPYGFCKKDFRAWSDCFFDGILPGGMEDLEKISECKQIDELKQMEKNQKCQELSKNAG